MRLGDLLLLERRLELPRRRPRLLVGGKEAPHVREQLERFQLGAQVAELLGLLRRPLERCEPPLHLSDHVGKAEQVLLGGFELALGLLAPGLVLRDPGGLLEDAASVLGPRADDEADAALLDDRVRARADAGAEEKLGDVEQAAGGLVDLVFAVAVAEQPPRHGDLAEARVLRRHEAAVVLEGERDLGHSGGRPRLAAAEDDVLHRAAAQVFRALLAHSPADGVDHVRLAAAVGPDDARDAVVEGEDHPVGKRFEAGDLEAPDFHLPREDPRIANRLQGLSCAAKNGVRWRKTGSVFIASERYRGPPTSGSAAGAGGRRARCHDRGSAASATPTRRCSPRPPAARATAAACALPPGAER